MALMHPAGDSYNHRPSNLQKLHATMDFIFSINQLYEDEEELNRWIWKSLVLFQGVLREMLLGPVV
jgi:hypothetical protein